MNLKKYQIYFRSGTNFHYSGLNFIDMDNEVWNFTISKDKFMLVKFFEERNPETEKYELSNKKIELIKL